MLRRSTLYEKATRNQLWDPEVTFTGFSPFLVGDAGYPLLPWFLVPHRAQQNLALADALFNQRLQKARILVENAFELLKQSFRELLVKSDLEVSFLPDVIVACALLYNMLLGQSQEQVETLLNMLQQEGLDNHVDDDDIAAAMPREVVMDETALANAVDKCRQLGVHLALQRQVLL